MQRKTCSVCGTPANISLCILASTVGQSPRLQGSAKAILFCKSCLEASTTGQGPEGLFGVRQRVNEAFHALAGTSCTCCRDPKPLTASVGLERRVG
jgi:hypothetical protein